MGEKRRANLDQLIEDALQFEKGSFSGLFNFIRYIEKQAEGISDLLYEVYIMVSKMIKGIVIALGFILPGISGGVLAAILGIYERMIRFLAHPFKQLKEDVLYFLPVAIGMLLGIGLFSYPIEYLLEHLSSICFVEFCRCHYRYSPEFS